MRNLVIIVLALALLLPACTAFPAETTTSQTPPPVTATANTPEPPTLLIDAKEFSGWLDTEKLLPHLSQEDFEKLISDYTLDGTAVLDVAHVTEYCANPGSYYSANGNGFSFVNQTDHNDGWYYQTNRITVETLLEGMENPFGLDFEDTLTVVLDQFLEDFDPETDFIPDKDNRWEMTLYQGTADRFFLTRNGSSYSLTYSQAKVFRHSETRLINVDRSVVLEFNGLDQRLAKIRLEMVESWPTGN